MTALSTETLTALTALVGIFGGYLFRFYTARNDYQLKTQLSEKDLLTHILDLQRQVVTLSSQNAELLEEISRLRNQVAQLQSVIDGFKLKNQQQNQNRRLTTNN